MCIRDRSNSYKESESVPNKTSGAQKKVWGERPAVNTQQHRTGDQRAVNTMEFINKAASTSNTEPKTFRQQEEKKIPLLINVCLLYTSRCV